MILLETWFDSFKGNLPIINKPAFMDIFKNPSTKEMKEEIPNLLYIKDRIGMNRRYYDY